MRLEFTSGQTIKKATVEDLVAAVEGLQDESMMLIASDKPHSFLHVSGGPGQFNLRYHDGEQHKQFECMAMQNADTTLTVMKAYLSQRSTFKSAVLWNETTPSENDKSDWEDPMEGQVNRGGCTTVLALAALAGLGLWVVVTVA